MKWSSASTVLVLGLVLSGCGGKGLIKARSRFTAQHTPTPVQMNFETEIFDSGGTLTIRLPSGEEFSGPYEQISPDSAGDTLGTPWGGWGGWPAYWNDWGSFGAAWVQGKDYATFMQNYSGKVVATLFGNRGDTMRCRFQLANPDEGMAGGGLGECQTSTGAHVEAQF